MDKLQNNKEVIIGLAVGLAILGGVWLFNRTPSSELSAATPQETQTVEVTQGISMASSEIELDEADGNIDWTSLPSTNVSLSNESLVITEGGTYILAGESTSGVVVSTEENIRLILNGVKIISETSAAINIENADNAVIDLADGSANYLEDAEDRSDEEVSATLFSKNDLSITGTGQLSVKSNFADGIVSKDDLTIYSGTIIVESVDEGIRGKDSVHIIDGTISVVAGDDGIKASNETEEGEGYVHIEGGTIVVSAGDDGIKAVSSVVIDGGSVTVEKSYEGIEATSVTINGGNVTVFASDDGINAVSSGLGGEVYIYITGGVVNVTVGTGDTDGLDANGSIYISGGDVTVTAPGMSTLDYDDEGVMTGGTLTVNGEQLTEIPEHTMGGPGGGAQGR